MPDARAALGRTGWGRAEGDARRLLQPPDECDGSRGRARERWTTPEILKSSPSFLRGAVSGKPTQGPFQLHRGLGGVALLMEINCK